MIKLQKNGPIALLTLDRPDSMNALGEPGDGDALRQGQMASYDTLMEMSAAAQALMHHTEDHQEGVAAILERRTPTFVGK